MCFVLCMKKKSVPSIFLIRIIYLFIRCFLKDFVNCVFDFSSFMLSGILFHKIVPEVVMKLILYLVLHKGIYILL